jgi:hypothetical protein
MSLLHFYPSVRFACWLLLILFKTFRASIRGRGWEKRRHVYRGPGNAAHYGCRVEAGSLKPVDTKLRLYRYYSIKLMLAWESAAAPNLLFPPLSLSLVAKLTRTALGSGILFSYPELATIAGVQGMLIYAFSSALPMLIFGFLGPVIRRKCPEGFVLTEWTKQRYGTLTMLYLSVMTLLTLFLYMVSELSAIGQVVTALTGLDGLPVIIVQCVITTIYTCKSRPQSSNSKQS